MGPRGRKKDPEKKQETSQWRNKVKFGTSKLSYGKDFDPKDGLFAKKERDGENLRKLLSIFLRALAGRKQKYEPKN